MDRLAQDVTKRGVRIEFVKESLTFIGEDSPMANLTRLWRRVAAGEQKAKLAREFGISRKTQYQYMRMDG